MIEIRRRFAMKLAMATLLMAGATSTVAHEVTQANAAAYGLRPSTFNCPALVQVQPLAPTDQPMN